MNKKNQLIFYLTLALSAIFILIACLLEGRATQRFAHSFDEHLKSFKEAVEHYVPEKAGSWIASPSEDQIGIKDERIRTIAGAAGSLSRRYHSNSDHSDIVVNITCGYSRNVGAHTPDVCFTGSGANQETSVETFSVDYQMTFPNPANPKEPITEERTATFKTAIFSEATTQYRQRVFWGWKGVGTGWVAPRFPRLYWWNSNEPICKMYISLNEDSGNSKGKVDSLKDAELFMKAFLPQLDEVLTGSFVPEGKTGVNDNNDEEKSPSSVETTKKPEVKGPETSTAEPKKEEEPAKKPDDDDDEFPLPSPPMDF